MKDLIWNPEEWEADKEALRQVEAQAERAFDRYVQQMEDRD